MKKLTLANIQQTATQRGGKCLSTVYINQRTKYLWQCRRGHTWEATGGAIRIGRWCPHCRKGTIEEMQAIAHRQGGKCLSSQYISIKTLLTWQCAAGHQWDAAPYSIKRGSWCLKCSQLKQRNTIEQMEQIAKQRGGACLSRTYVSNRKKLLWKCKYGHQWEATPGTIINKGRWCLECSSGLGERIVRAYFEHLFRKPFPKVRPDWLRSKKDVPLELDGYFSPLGLAFEHQGKQHYQQVYYQTARSLRALKRRDRRKRDICRRHGVNIISVPEVPTMISVEELMPLLRMKLNRLNILLPKSRWDTPVNLEKAYSTYGADEQLKVVQAIAKERGGKCLAEDWKGDGRKILWECSEGHKWLTTPNSIKSGRWCQRCAGLAKGTIEEMREIAKSRGGKCLSKRYINQSVKLKWECAQGHRWKARPGNIKNANSWCPVCRYDKQRKKT